MPEDRQLPSVQNNLNRLTAALANEDIWGLPGHCCTVLHQPDDADTVIQALRAAAEAATDTLLFYFAGHGLSDPTVGPGLFLGLPGSYEPHGTHTALAYEHVRKEMRRCRAPRKVVILDCCWSGKAAAGVMGDDHGAELKDVGVAVLTATAATRPALAPPGSTLTAFTGALLELIEEGIPGGPGLLTVEQLYAEARVRLLARGLPEPQFTGIASGASIVLARNARADAVPAGGSPPVLRRAGRYEEARRVLLHRAAGGDADAVREVALRLRRAGDYASAQQLERAQMSGGDTLRVFVRDRLLGT
jgi:hypothetical protein